MALINKITGEINFQYNGEVYPVRPEFGLCAALEGTEILPNQEFTSLYEVAKLFEKVRPVNSVLSNITYEVLAYTGNRQPKTKIQEHIFKCQNSDEWLLIWQSCYAVISSLLRGGDFNESLDDDPENAEPKEVDTEKK